MDANLSTCVTHTNTFTTQLDSEAQDNYTKPRLQAETNRAHYIQKGYTDGGLSVNTVSNLKAVSLRYIPFVFMVSSAIFRLQCGLSISWVSDRFKYKESILGTVPTNNTSPLSQRASSPSASKIDRNPARMPPQLLLPRNRKLIEIPPGCRHNSFSQETGN